MLTDTIKSYKFSLIYLTLFMGYTYVAYEIFNKINKVPGLIVDEIFHIPQAKLFCSGNYSYYDPKITTPPGLYFLTALILGPFKHCTTYWMRFVNFAVGILNVELIRHLCTLKGNSRRTQMSNFQRQLYEMMSAFSLASLPPLFFFNNVYYTDTVSISTVLLMMISAKNNKHGRAILFAVISVFMRQTNIVWMCVVFGEYFLTLCLQVLLGSHRRRLARTVFSLDDLKEGIVRCATRRIPFHMIYLGEYIVFAAYLFLINAFLFFVYYNGGVVLGDKEAHQLAIHLPQLLYFCIFVLIFMLPHLLLEMKSFLQDLKDHFKWFLVGSCVLSVIIAMNTEIHPYLLADNRHYTFYLWNRFLKYTLVRFLMIFVYIFVIYAIYKRLCRTNSFIYIFVYIIGSFLVLIFNKLIDVRYFFLPYIALRSRIAVPNKYIVLLEFLTNVIINVITLQIFLSKEFMWPDFDYPQRIIW